VEPNQPITGFGTLQVGEEKVEVTFQGAAVEPLRMLKKRLGVETEQEVVRIGVEVLLSAVDKEVLLRQDNRTEVVQLWRP
jgi:hypothetical protein